jgi:hypothetical protein
MTESAANVIVGFRTLRKFCENVAELLVKTNELMEEAGWEQIKRYVPAVEINQSLDNPKWWMPDTFFCYYEGADAQRLLPFIVVVVDDLYGEDPNRVKEPLISAGWAEYPVDTIAKEEWGKDYRVHYSHLWVKNRQDDGTLCSGDARDIWEDKKMEEGAIRLTTFAYPIEVITDSEALKEKIVQPLLEMLSQVKE